MNKLIKECPFCGKVNVCINTDEEVEGLDEGEGSGYFTVVCDVNNRGCGASGGYGETREEALERWNRRIKDE